MKKLLLFSIIALLFSVTVGCEKENEKQANTLKSEGMIVYTGEPATDGCGYFVKINKTKYKPIKSLPTFCVDGLMVNVEYQVLKKKWTCNWQGEYSQIKIINITKK